VNITCDLAFLTKNTPLKELVLDQSELPMTFYANLLPNYELESLTIKDCLITTDPFFLFNTSKLKVMQVCGCSKVEARRVLPHIFTWQNLDRLAVVRIGDIIIISNLFTTNQLVLNTTTLFSRKILFPLNFFFSGFFLSLTD